jgi:hypothetical protein
MPEIAGLLSQRQNEALESYAQEQGLTIDEAVKRLALEALEGRLKTRFKRGEVKAFKSPKSD